MSIKNEPVIAGFGVTALYAAAITFLSEFGIWTPTEGQYQALLGLVVPISAIVAWAVRRKTYGPVTVTEAMKPSPEDLTPPYYLGTDEPA